VGHRSRHIRLSPKRSIRISAIQKFTVINCLGVGFPLNSEMMIKRISTKATTGSESNSRLKGVEVVSRISSIQSHAKWWEAKKSDEVPSLPPHPSQIRRELRNISVLTHSHPPEPLPPPLLFATICMTYFLGRLPRTSLLG
jgi:hypothetical protein